jgi:hypothetical protein
MLATSAQLGTALGFAVIVPLAARGGGPAAQLAGYEAGFTAAAVVAGLAALAVALRSAQRAGDRAGARSPLESWITRARRE